MMTLKEYQELKEKIKQRYIDDLAALDRVFELVNGKTIEVRRQQLEMPEEEVARTKGHKKGKPSPGNKLQWARHRAKKDGKDLDALPPEEFAKYLVPGPASGGGTGE